MEYCNSITKMAELVNTTEFANPKISEVMDLVKRLKEDIVFLRTRPENSNNGSGQFSAPQQQQQQQQQNQQEFNNSDGNREVFFTQQQSGLSNTEEDQLKTIPGNFYLVNELPRRLKQAISYIMQFTSTSYQLHILRQAFTTILFKKESQKGSYINEQFLSTFERAWIQLEFQEKLQHEQANIYTTLRENIQTYFPEKQIFNHLSPKIQNEIPDVLLKKMQEKHEILKEEINALSPSEKDRQIGKPLVKINQLREYLMQLEPCYNFKEFVNNDCNVSFYIDRFLEKAELFQNHEKMVKQYKEMVENFKNIEYEAYRGKRTARLL